ncbi:MAG: ACT domain-containing protein, partial [Gammaproteobacteria bacterium]
NIQFTPHLGASTHEAQTAVGLEIAQQIATFLKTNEAINAINLPRIPAKESTRLKPYQELARKLGRLLSAMCGDAITRLDFALSGPVVELNTRPVFNDALVGLLEAHLSIVVNQVNANFLAKRQGIQLSESCSLESHDYLTSLSLTAHTGVEAITLSGTLFDERYPRLIRINNYLIEAPLSGHMVFTRHQDKPGVVGDLGALLAKNHINISTMQVGVAESSEHAIAVIGVSNPLDENMLAELRELPAISRVLQITL